MLNLSTAQNAGLSCAQLMEVTTSNLTSQLAAKCNISSELFRLKLPTEPLDNTSTLRARLNSRQGLAL